MDLRNKITINVWPNGKMTITCISFYEIPEDPPRIKATLDYEFDIKLNSDNKLDIKPWV